MEKYRPKGFWRGKSAIKKKQRSVKKQAFEFFKKSVWQIYLPAPKKIIRPRFDVSAKDEVHQADMMFLSFGTVMVGKTSKAYKYALTQVDVGTRNKEAEPLTPKDITDVIKSFEKIYSRHLKYPKI